MFVAEEIVLQRLRVVKHLNGNIGVRRLQAMIRVGTCEALVELHLQVIEGVSKHAQYFIRAARLANGKEEMLWTDG